MKFRKALFLTALSALAIPALTSCGPKDKVGGASLVQIKCYKGGYGDEFIREMVKQFNTTFASKGYSAEIVEASSNVTESSKQELFDTKHNQIDLYLTNGSNYTDAIDRSQATLKNPNKSILANLDDILTSKAIGLDGKEEGQTIGERLFDGVREVSTYNGKKSQFRDKVYKLPWADAMTGLFVNLNALGKFGLEVPLTSNELISAVETIANTSTSPKVYPYAWGGSNCAGYWCFLFETYFAQYSGVEAYEKFMKCEPTTGTIESDGWKVYQDPGLLKALEAMYPILKKSYSIDGSASLQHTEAQVNFMTGKSVFMVNGDWVMNEMKEQYRDKCNDIAFVQMPILSCLGTENGLTDSQLHDVVKGIDEGKTDAEIKAVVPAATDAALAKIRDARSIHCSIGAGHEMFIPYYSDAVEATKTFIRFMYSNDGCNIFREKAWGNLPIKYTIKNPSLSNDFQKSLDSVYARGNTQVVSDNADYNHVRQKAQLYLFNKSEWMHPNTFKNIILNRDSASETIREAFVPANIISKEVEYVHNNWSSYMNKLK